MGFPLVAFQWLCDIKNKYICVKNPEALELGSSDVTCSVADIVDFYKKNNLSFDVNKLKKHFDNGRLSCRFFYLDIGFSTLDIIDIDGGHDALKFDLNEDIFNNYNYKEQYDFVQNAGTAEHCFNQYQVFKNVHNLTKVGGVMTHIGPISCGLNHGMLHIQPQTYFDIAQENGYEVLDMQIFLNHKTSNGDVYTSLYHYRDDSIWEFIDNIHRQTQMRYIIGCYIAMRKTKDGQFKIPMQHSGRDIKNNFFSLSEATEREVYLNIEDLKTDKVAIFGLGKAGKIAYEFAKSLHLQVQYFIDDFNDKKIFDGVKIITSSEYKNLCLDEDIILIAGPEQKIFNPEMTENIHIYKIRERSYYVKQTWSFHFLGSFISRWQAILDEK